MQRFCLPSVTLGDLNVLRFFLSCDDLLAILLLVPHFIEHACADYLVSMIMRLIWKSTILGSGNYWQKELNTLFKMLPQLLKAYRIAMVTI